MRTSQEADLGGGEQHRTSVHSFSSHLWSPYCVPDTMLMLVIESVA